MKKADSPRIFRVLVPARSLARSRRFYETLLGVRGRDVAPGRVYFDCGSVILGVLDYAAADGEGITPPNEALYFATADLEGLYHRARRLGGLSTELIHNDPANPAGEMVLRPWGERSFYDAADPSGNALCFVDERTLFTGTPRQVRALRGSSNGHRRVPARKASSRPRSLPSGRRRGAGAQGSRSNSRDAVVNVIPRQRGWTIMTGG